MKHIRLHRIQPRRSWQTVGMYDGAQVLAPYFKDGKLYLPCIEDDERPEVAERICVVRPDQGLDEAFGDREAMFVGGAIGPDIGPVFLFVEVAEELPQRVITHPDLQDREKSQD
jgi:hypothetical protein